MDTMLELTEELRPKADSLGFILVVKQCNKPDAFLQELSQSCVQSLCL